MTLRQIRAERGLRLIDLMLATGVDAGRLSCAERGLKRLRKRERELIASVLDLDISQIQFDLEPVTKLPMASRGI